MEKGFQSKYNRYPRIVITGPESTGKTALAEELACHFQGLLVPEYARTYVEQLNRSYTYRDVEKIARHQIRSRNRITREYTDWIFFDTDLIITRVWFLEVYKRCPHWLDRNLHLRVMDLYLLCNNEIPWKADGVRENGGDRRAYLFERYREELESFGFRYAIIEGTNAKRYESALYGLNNFLEEQAQK